MGVGGEGIGLKLDRIYFDKSVCDESVSHKDSTIAGESKEK